MAATGPADRLAVPEPTGVIVAGFKSLAEHYKVPIRPLTVLAGANSSGKSSLLQPLLLLKQTLESGPDPGALLIHDSHVRFTTPEQFRPKHPHLADGGFPDLMIGVEMGHASLTCVFSGSGESVELKRNDIVLPREAGGAFSLRPRMTPAQIRAVQPEANEMLRERFSESLGKRLKWRIRQRRCFLEPELVPVGSGSSRVSMFVATATPTFEDAIRAVIHVPALRGNPERTYKTTSVSGPFPGPFDSYVASLVNHWQEADKEKLAEVHHFLEALGLTWKIVSRRINATQVQLQVGRLTRARRGGAYDLVDLVDVGFGVSQALPVVVSLVAARPGQLVYLEQPEIHLHPRAQVALAGILAKAARRGVRVVTETHSSLLVRSLQAIVAEQALDHDQVAFHWFQRGPRGTTRISTAALDESGAYGDWPEDFGEIDLQAESRYLSAAHSALQ